jgi:hypothetical protein
MDEKGSDEDEAEQSQSALPVSSGCHKPHTSITALTSLFLGSLALLAQIGIVALGLLPNSNGTLSNELSLFTAPTVVGALIFGHIARHRIRQNAPTFRGAAFARLGLIFGYSCLALKIARGLICG